MKTVLCFGDSLTWGFDAETRTRHSLENRWPSTLAETLGNEVHIIAEGLNGRTSAFNDYTSDCNRNGVRVLPTLLETHHPIDLVIIMLGTNDLKDMTSGTARAAVAGIGRLVSLTRNHQFGTEAPVPDVLIVCPPKFCETADHDVASMFSDGIRQSSMLPNALSELADDLSCGFFDSNSIVKTTPTDGIHMDAENTRELGRGLASTVKLMLGL